MFAFTRKLPLAVVNLIFVFIIVFFSLLLFSNIAVSFVKNAFVDKLRERANVAEELHHFINEQKNELIYTQSRPKKRSDFISASLTTENEYSYGMKSTQFINAIFSQSGTGFELKITSHSPINPNNLASKVAMRKKEDWKNQTTKNIEDEYFELNDNRLTYVRPIYAKQECIVCHGSWENTPGFVKSAFPLYNPDGLSFDFSPAAGFNFKNKELIGFSEGTTKFPNVWVYFYENHATQVGLMFLTIGLLIYFLFERFMSAPIRKISKLLNDFSTSNEIKVDGNMLSDEHGELGELNNSVCRVGMTMKSQSEKIKERTGLLNQIGSASQHLQNKSASEDESNLLVMLSRFNRNLRVKVSEVLNKEKI